MSAFVISESCMDKCVSVFLDRSMRHRSCEEGDKIGAALFQLNVRAVRERYGDETAAPSYTYRPTMPTPIVALKALECLRYQCTEGDVPSDPLFTQLDERIHALRAQIVRALPEYERAGWDS